MYVTYPFSRLLPSITGSRRPKGNAEAGYLLAGVFAFAYCLIAANFPGNHAEPRNKDNAHECWNGSCD